MKEDKPGRGGVGSGLAIGEEVISPLELLISRSAEVETLLPFCVRFLANASHNAPKSFVPASEL